MQCRYIAEVMGSSLPKVQQYLQLRPLATETASYTPAAYLQAVGGWRQRQAVAQLRTGSSWLAEETGRHNGPDRAERVCQWCSSTATDDVEHTHRWCLTARLWSPTGGTARVCTLGSRGPWLISFTKTLRNWLHSRMGAKCLGHRALLEVARLRGVR